MRIAHVSTFSPLRCGIAFYVSDLIDALPSATNLKFALHYGRNSAPDAAGEANNNDKSAIRRLANAITQSRCDVICLQHEFGIWGGSHGENIFEFLDGIDRPLVTTFHSTFSDGRRPDIQKTILETLMERSASAIVLNENSRTTLSGLINVPKELISVVPHGVPDLPFTPVPAVSAKTPLQIFSFGFFRPDKGLEYIIEAVRSLRQAGFNFRYRIAGSPQAQFPEQERYFDRIQAMIREHSLEETITLQREFLTREKQIELARDSHLGVFAYQDPLHASSGAVALTLAAGRPVVCTPFEFARANKRENGGIYLATDFHAVAIQQSLAEAMAPNTDLDAAARNAYKQTRSWTWPLVAKTYKRFLESAKSSQPL